MAEVFFSSNLKKLMSIFGDNQSTLAAILNVSEASVSYWVNGRNLPCRKTLDRIASRYSQTYDELLYCDLSYLGNFGHLPTSDTILKLGSSMLPFIDPDPPVKSIHFQKAIETHRRFIRAMASKTDVAEKDRLHMLDEYVEALFDDECVEAACNLLPFFAMHCFNFMNDGVLSEFDKTFGIQQRMENFFLRVLTGDTPFFTTAAYKEIAAFADEYDYIVVILLKIIKRSPDYYDIADYYQALFYLIGFVPNDNPKLVNQKIGYEWMRIFASMGNPYALRFMNHEESSHS